MFVLLLIVTIHSIILTDPILFFFYFSTNDACSLFHSFYYYYYCNYLRNRAVCVVYPPSSIQEPLKAGDIVKLDLGCHIDGYIAVAAHTLIVGDDPATVGPSPESVDPNMGNVAVAAYMAMQAAAASIKAGATNVSVTEAVKRVADAYGVRALASVRMHQMKRYVIDGVKEVALREPTAEELEAGEEKASPCTFEQGEVYAVDVAMSTGEGRPRASNLRTTVYRRNAEANYRLKIKNSRALLSEVDKRYPALPFTLADFEDERGARMGVTECLAHGLLTPYPVLHEARDAYVAHFKCTVLLLSSGSVRVTGLELPAYFKTEKQPDEETAKLLAEVEELAAKKAKKKASKKKKKKAAA
jgi:curved DNA binding protein